jgi:hypothetical protein
MATSSVRISIGFQGGQVLALKVTDKALGSLNEALPAGGWHVLESDEGPVRMDLSQVLYVRSESDELRVGFGA